MGTELDPLISTLRPVALPTRLVPNALFQTDFAHYGVAGDPSFFTQALGIDPADAIAFIADAVSITSGPTDHFWMGGFLADVPRTYVAPVHDLQNVNFILQAIATTTGLNANYKMVAIFIAQDNDDFMALLGAYDNNFLPDRYIHEVRRFTAGVSTRSTLTSPRVDPVHFRLVKIGTAYTGYYSADGMAWTLIGTLAKAMVINWIGVLCGDDADEDFLNFEIHGG